MQATVTDRRSCQRRERQFPARSFLIPGIYNRRVPEKESRDPWSRIIRAASGILRIVACDVSHMIHDGYCQYLSHIMWTYITYDWFSLT
jgi:hypothetical protein